MIKAKAQLSINQRSGLNWKARVIQFMGPLETSGVIC